VNEAQGDERFLSMAAVRDLVGGLSRVTVYRLMRRGQFPAAVKIGGRSAWVESEVRDWMRARVAERDARVSAPAGRVP
jgi:prophage regulatory protein